MTEKQYREECRQLQSYEDNFHRDSSLQPWILKGPTRITRQLQTDKKWYLRDAPSRHKLKAKRKQLNTMG